jgi:hypothetical protein
MAKIEQYQARGTAGKSLCSYFADDDLYVRKHYFAFRGESNMEDQEAANGETTL